MWSEVITGEIGAINFMTGSGGFLQALLNGYAGIRIFLDRLEINTPRLPANTEFLSIYGKHRTHAYRFFIYIPTRLRTRCTSTIYPSKYCTIDVQCTIVHIVLFVFICNYLL